MNIIQRIIIIILSIFLVVLFIYIIGTKTQAPTQDTPIEEEAIEPYWDRPWEWGLGYENQDDPRKRIPKPGREYIPDVTIGWKDGSKYIYSLDEIADMTPDDRSKFNSVLIAIAMRWIHDNSPELTDSVFQSLLPMRRY